MSDLAERIDKEIEARKRAGIQNITDMYPDLTNDQYRKAINTAGIYWQRSAKKRKTEKIGGRTKRKRTHKKKNKPRKKSRRHFK